MIVVALKVGWPLGYQRALRLVALHGDIQGWTGLDSLAGKLWSRYLLVCQPRTEHRTPINLSLISQMKAHFNTFTCVLIGVVIQLSKNEVVGTKERDRRSETCGEVSSVGMFVEGLGQHYDGLRCQRYRN